MPTFRDAFTGDIVSRDNFDFIDSSEHRERARQQRVEYERIGNPQAPISPQGDSSYTVGTRVAQQAANITGVIS